MELAPEKTLELVITSYQRLSPSVESSHTVRPGRTHCLGRATECDWHLPDPERVVSSRHAEIFYRDSQFRVRDISTNGLFLNGAGEPLGQGNEAPLQSGDRLGVGDYELLVSLNGPDAEAAEVRPEVTPATAPSAHAPHSASGAMAFPDRLAEAPVEATRGGNPTLASGLTQQGLGDAHVELPAAGIPEGWQWQSRKQSTKGEGGNPSPETGPQLQALLEGLGLGDLSPEQLSPSMLHSLGELTRILLERLLQLLRVRAEQKQQLRVQQTLFQRQENNPLKFSASARDALDALLLRHQGAFLPPRSAVEEAFDDIVGHEQALMAGVDAVVQALLEEPGESVFRRRSLLRGARPREQWLAWRRQLLEEFGDRQQMLRSDAFVEAYEKASSVNHREPS